MNTSLLHNKKKTRPKSAKPKIKIEDLSKTPKNLNSLFTDSEKKPQMDVPSSLSSEKKSTPVFNICIQSLFDVIKSSEIDNLDISVLEVAAEAINTSLINKKLA